MRSDRYTKFVLTIIAVCLSALTLTGIGLPDFTTEAEATLAPAPSSVLQDRMKPGRETGAVRASTATYPLRWKVSWAAEKSDVGSKTHCGTAVVITNDSASSVGVEVEWFDWTGSSEGLSMLFLTAAAKQRIAITGGARSGPDTDYDPFVPDSTSDTLDFIGYGRVHAEDPRIHVAAFQYCRDAQGTGKNIVSITQIPVYPVGATAQYFQAGMPATWTPPMAAPEVPE